MIEELRRICTLQRAYTSANTPEMEERGLLIRQAVPKEFRNWRAELSASLAQFGDDMGIEGSDGIGRKTEAPWVRIFSQRMAPAATEGFYVVLHFAANGSAVFMTVGFGSTEWNNGDLKVQSDEALEQRREWARGILTSRLGTLEPFEDQIELGAKADLPRTFEKATVIARRISVQDLDVEDFRHMTIDAAKRLAVIYEAQVLGSDMAEVVEREMAATTRPQRFGQGFGLTTAERTAVERRAMVVAKDWLRAQGFKMKDTSKTKPYDYEAIREDVRLKVEVKGTTSMVADVIVMTANEVSLHIAEAGATALIVVSNIDLKRTKNGVRGEGGEIFVELGWNIETWDRTPIAYRLRRQLPSSRASR